MPVFLSKAYTVTLIALVSASVFAGTRCSAKSLDPNHPAMLKAGVTTGQIDALVGAHYYALIAGPGDVTISVSFKADSLLGAAIKVPLTVEIWNAKRTAKSGFELVSTGNSVDRKFTATLTAKDTYLLDLLPPKAYVRLGGQYEITTSGAIKGTDTTSGVGDPILQHRYRWLGGCPASDQQSCSGIQFRADGSFAVPGGDRGVWRVFDRERNIYTLVWADSRKSVKLLAARGLVEVNDPGVIVFQEMP